MARPWIATKYPGIRYRLHETRTHAGRRDRYFAIYYRLDGKRCEEGVGWESAGWSETKVNALLAELKENQRTGKHPQTLRAQAEQAAHERQEEAALRPTASRAAPHRGAILGGILCARVRGSKKTRNLGE